MLACAMTDSEVQSRTLDYATLREEPELPVWHASYFSEGDRDAGVWLWSSRSAPLPNGRYPKCDRDRNTKLLEDRASMLASHSRGRIMRTT